MESSTHTNKRNNEQGSAGVKLVIVLVIIVLVANAGYNFVPVAYQAESFKQDMQTAVLQALASPSSYGKPNDLVKDRVYGAARVNEIPDDAFVDVKVLNGAVSARVYYVKKIPLLPFGIWDHDYVFDHTATPAGFLTQSD